MAATVALGRDMRIIARFSKKEDARFVSHLDIQRLFGRAFSRAGIPVAYSQGFNPHPVLAFATALSTGVTSDAEWLDVKLERDLTDEAFMSALNPTLPAGFEIREAIAVDDKLPSLSALLASAAYDVRFLPGTHKQELIAALETLLAGPIVIDKRTKAGIKPVDIRPQVLSAAFRETEGSLVLHVEGVLNAAGSLGCDAFVRALLARAGETAANGEYADYSIHRMNVFFQNGKNTPV